MKFYSVTFAKDVQIMRYYTSTIQWPLNPEQRSGALKGRLRESYCSVLE